MTAPASEATETPVPRERGWGKLAFATVAFLVIPLTPLLRVLLPIERTALLIAPALAALTVAAWLAGGRAALAVIWVSVAAWSVAQLSGAGLFSLLQGGWALLVAGAFATLLIARRDPELPFFPRALRAVALALAAGLLVAGATPGGPARVANAIAVESGRRAEESRTGWRQMTSTPEWTDFAARNPAAGEMASRVDEELAALPVKARMLFPALIALQALAALALAWAFYHRIGRARLGPPLAPVRDFRFNDQLVWGIVAGLAMLIVPGMAIVRAVGANLLVFFGALYTIRGVGVFLWMWSPGKLATAVLVVVSLLFWHILGVMAFGLGVGDTWFDWRSRARQKV